MCLSDICLFSCSKCFESLKNWPWVVFTGSLSILNKSLFKSMEYSKMYNAVIARNQCAVSIYCLKFQSRIRKMLRHDRQTVVQVMHASVLSIPFDPIPFHQIGHASQNSLAYFQYFRYDFMNVSVYTYAFRMEV